MQSSRTGGPGNRQDIVLFQNQIIEFEMRYDVLIDISEMAAKILPQMHKFRE